jgi:hypothetical protein
LCLQSRSRASARGGDKKFRRARLFSCLWGRSDAQRSAGRKVFFCFVFVFVFCFIFVIYFFGESLILLGAQGSGTGKGAKKRPKKDAKKANKM